MRNLRSPAIWSALGILHERPPHDGAVPLVRALTNEEAIIGVRAMVLPKMEAHLVPDISTGPWTPICCDPLMLAEPFL